MNFMPSNIWSVLIADDQGGSGKRLPVLPPRAAPTPIEWPGEGTTACHNTEKDGSIRMRGC